ncbi:MAG: hypothetical protein ACOYJD_02020 [Christensenellales bacterium]|jgi:hypothetical protein
MKRRIDVGFIAWLTAAAVIAVIAAVILLPLSKAAANTGQAQAENIKEAINRSLVQCYALEGSYPASLAYLEENYGLVLDHENYYYDYQTGGIGNFRPSLMVVEK